MKKTNKFVVFVVVALIAGGIFYHVDRTEKLSNTIENTEAIVEDLSEEQATLTIRKEELFEQLEQERQENKELEERIDNLEEDLEEKENTIDNRNSEIEGLESDLEAKIANDRAVAKAEEEAREESVQTTSSEPKPKEKETKVEEETKTVVASESKDSEPKKQEPKEEKASKSSGSSLGIFNVTHYSVGDSMTPSDVTANGTDVSNTIHTNSGHRIIAVDTNVIPMNTLVEVSMDGTTFTAVSSDTGSAIKGNKIDLLVSSPSEALRKGVKKAEIKIIE